MVAGGLRALRQHDLKLLLAFGTVSQLGLMVAVFGIGTAGRDGGRCGAAARPRRVQGGQLHGRRHRRPPVRDARSAPTARASIGRGRQLGVTAVVGAASMAACAAGVRIRRQGGGCSTSYRPRRRRVGRVRWRGRASPLPPRRVTVAYSVRFALGRARADVDRRRSRSSPSTCSCLARRSPARRSCSPPSSRRARRGADACSIDLCRRQPRGAPTQCRTTSTSPCGTGSTRPSSASAIAFSPVALHCSSVARRRRPRPVVLGRAGARRRGGVRRCAPRRSTSWPTV